jgi:hypothetical protein
VGYIEDIEAMELSDEQKQQLVAAHRAEVDPLKKQNEANSARARKNTVEQEVVALSDAGFDEAPGLLAYFRRVLLSADAEEPGAVLLSDTEMDLSGDQATGATGRESVSVAGALRKFVELLPKTEEGKFKVNLSDMANEADDHGRPDDGDGTEAQQKTEKSRSNLAKLTGKDLTRSSRGKRYGIASVTGGGE